MKNENEPPFFVGTNGRKTSRLARKKDESESDFRKRMTGKYVGIEKADLHFVADHDVHPGKAADCKICNPSMTKSKTSQVRHVAVSDMSAAMSALNRTARGIPVAYLSYKCEDVHMSVVFCSGVKTKVLAALQVCFDLKNKLPSKVKITPHGEAPFSDPKHPENKVMLVDIEPKLNIFTLLSKVNDRKWIPHVSSSVDLTPRELNLSDVEILISLDEASDAYKGYYNDWMNVKDVKPKTDSLPKIADKQVVDKVEKQSAIDEQPVKLGVVNKDREAGDVSDEPQ